MELTNNTKSAKEAHGEFVNICIGIEGFSQRFRGYITQN